MKIGIILGRGVEGVGVTKNVVEFQKLYPQTKIYATIDKLWPRMNSMKFDVNYFSASDWDSKPKNNKKFNKILNVIETIDEINQLDCCIVYSVPSKKHPEPCIEHFTKMLDLIKVRKSMVQVDHSIHSITRNANLIEICNKLDVLLCHSTSNPFSKWVSKNKIKTPLTNMGVGVNFTKEYWKPIEEQNSKVIRWVGRTAMWKGPDLMIDLHNGYFKQNSFITILEGLEASIQYSLILYKKPETFEDRREVVNYFRPEKDKDDTVGRLPDYGNETINSGAYLYPGYTHSEMIERMSLSGFGSDLMHFKENIYGNNIEYCHSDCFISGVIPLFHKHFCDNVIHKKIGDPVSKCKNTGTLGIDFSNADEICNMMIKLSNDNILRDEWRNMMYDFWKDHCDAKTVYADIIEKTLNTKQKIRSLF